MPCFSTMRRHCTTTRGSTPASTCGSTSTTVTREPSAANRLANSQPTTPPPITRRCSGHALEPEDAVGGDHQRMLHVDARQARRLGADAHDEVIERIAPVARDDGVTVDETLRANDRHVATLACGLDAAAHLDDDLLLALHHPREVDLRLGHDDAEVGSSADLAQQVGAGEQRLRRNATPVEAGPAQLGALDQRDLGTRAVPHAARRHRRRDHRRGQRPDRSRCDRRASSRWSPSIRRRRDARSRTPR